MADVVAPGGRQYAPIARYLFAVLGGFGLAIIYGLKINLSVAFFRMINHTAVNSSPTQMTFIESGCSGLQAGPSWRILKDGPFVWPRSIQEAMINSYMAGYILAQLPAGRIAELFSAKWVMFFSVAVNVICTLLTPVASNMHYSVMLTMRILEGIGGGMSFPAMHVMIANWAPPSERSTISSVVYSGTAVGAVISMFLSRLIGGFSHWKLLFYLMGGASGIWLIFWGVLIADTPDQQPFMSESERKYITSSLGSDRVKKISVVPWFFVLTSKPFLTILITHICNNWGWCIIMELPLYANNILKLNLGIFVFINALPYITMCLISLGTSRLLDMLLRRRRITVTMARKYATFVSCGIPMLAFIALIFIGCQRILSIFAISIAITFMGTKFSGFYSNHIDIAPNYAGTLMAMTNSIASVIGMFVPVFVGKMTQDDPTFGSWRIIFMSAVFFYLAAMVVYGFFASGEEQIWNHYGYLVEYVEAHPLKPLTQSNNPDEPVCDSSQSTKNQNNSDDTLEAK